MSGGTIRAVTLNPRQLSAERAFVTGGAGFIGSRLVRALVDAGADVVAYDNLHPQVHGPAPKIELAAPLIVGDVRDRAAMASAVAGHRPTLVFHLAAETGTGQSADEPSRYCETNVTGTAHLLEILRQQEEPPRRIVLAATRAVYGEGAYRDVEGRIVVPSPRATEDLAAGRFDPRDARGRALQAMPTPEDVPLVPGSVYGSTKLMQEHLLRQVPGSWEHVILRLQNVYGPGQSLRNPYTGVLSIFCQQALAGHVLDIFEDGRIDRDFVYVDDVVAAFVAAAHVPGAAGQTLNIGTGERAAIDDVAVRILHELGLSAERRRISGRFRPGDIRHAVADIDRARALLGWRPGVDLAEGVRRLVAWARA